MERNGERGEGENTEIHNDNHRDAEVLFCEVEEVLLRPKFRRHWLGCPASV